MLTDVGMFARAIFRGTCTTSLSIAFLQSVLAFLRLDGVDDSSGVLYVLSPSFDGSCFLFLLHVLGVASTS